MGREIRRVPANWEHPQGVRNYGRVGYLPMFDHNFEDEAQDYIRNFQEWVAKHPAGVDEDGSYYWEENPPPERECCVPYRKEEAIWYQVYETVSEGTPVSPPFATQEELIDYLCTNGDFWDQERGDPPWSREGAERFVRDVGSVPSGMAINGQVMTGVEALAYEAKKDAVE